MFFNKVKQVSSQVFNRGREIIRKAPEYIAKAIEYGKKGKKFLSQVADKADQAADIYDSIQGDVDPQGKARPYIKQGREALAKTRGGLDKGIMVSEKVAPLFD